MTKQRSGGNILVECLLRQGVDTAFGVPGESYLDVLDALYDVQNQLRMVVTRQEGGAAFMAEAYGKLTGRPGICFVTRGPGATNASIGVHTAMQNSTPMILFVGQVGRDMRDREAFQEVDYRQFFAGMTKWVTEIDSADRIPELVARAFSVALSGRPGPVVVALPEDMLRDQSDAAACERVVVDEPAVSAETLGRALAAIGAAKRPLLMIGGGGWKASGRAAIQRFAEKNHLPTIAVFRYQDLFDNGSDAYVGDASVGMSPHVAEVMQAADTILALNIRLGESTTDGWRILKAPKMRAVLIHSHASDAEIGKIYRPDIAIHAGPNQLATALADARVLGDWSDWQAIGRNGYLEARRKAVQTGSLNMVEVAAWLDQRLEDDAILTNGAGNFSVWPSRFITYRGSRRLLAPQSGAMGAGLPAAIAAKAVDATRQVVSFAGDGDFQMTMNELGTAAQEGLQPVILLLNNGMYGTIRAHQERNYPDRVLATRLRNPDFVAIARAYGFHAERIERTEDFAAAFDRAAASASGGLLELMIDPEDITPYQQLDAIKGKGKSRQQAARHE